MSDPHLPAPEPAAASEAFEEHGTQRTLVGLPRDQGPSAWKALKADWHLVLPLAALVWMLFYGFTPMFAGLTGLALTAILILGAAVAARISLVAFRYVFWLAVGLGAATFLEWGIYPVLAVIALLCLCCLWIQGGHKTLHTMKSSLVDGAKQGLVVGVACAVMGVIIGVLTLTGAASSFAGFILSVGEKSLFVTVAAGLLVVAHPVTDQIEFAMTAAFFAWHFLQKRRLAAVA
jgi:TRAP-type uncharacterized transport system fused permease subunit